MDDRLTFATRQDFHQWLTENAETSTGAWLVFGKTGGPKTLKADEALLEALCFGWIDGLMKSIDQTHYIKRFTPRRKGSKWSAKNRQLAEKLTGQKLMHPSGLAAIERAKNDGTWEPEAPAPITEEQIAILTEALTGREPALANYRKMPPSVKRTYTAHYLDAKTESTRAKRLEQIIARLNENLKPM